MSIYIDYLKYLVKSGNEHSLHSPFLFEFYTKVVKNKKSNPAFEQIEKLRKELLQNQTQIKVLDLGAGSLLDNNPTKRIASIAKNSKKSPRWGKLFYYIIQYYQHKSIFDLGTSLGVTTIYEALANTDAEIVSFEGCPETAKIAQQNFDKLAAKNINLVVGNIDETLPIALEKVEKLDFVFFDANHRYEPTIRYFEACLNKAHEDSCFIFDDIYWSDEMKEAWNYIKQHPRVSVSADFFWIGIVWFRKKQVKQDFVLR